MFKSKGTMDYPGNIVMVLPQTVIALVIGIGSLRLIKQAVSRYYDTAGIRNKHHNYPDNRIIRYKFKMVCNS